MVRTAAAIIELIEPRLAHHMSMRKTHFLFSLIVIVVAVAAALHAQDWQLIGPEGGDVRSLAYDPSNPDRILLGTSAGQLFESLDNGRSWAPYAHLGPGDEYVLDHILFAPGNPATLYVAGWSLFQSEEGDVFRSDDGGKTWRGLSAIHGKSVRTLAMAPSDHKVLVAGALDGVYRSRDAGATWERISPKGDPDLKNIESLAIDPQHPDVIYAGTFHLPWKTGDGGKNWHRINQGVLDDSDVFSIIVDPKLPQTVYASACSGIYKSTNSGELFARIKGIPHSAIRTRVLMQDPKRPSIVYAGTTGGLWKTLDGGSKWELYTTPDVVVNDILIDPRNPERVLLATDRGGILASNDGFDHYEASNRGFAHRTVGAMMADRKNPARLYVGVVNDKGLGGFFSSEDAGKTWKLWNKGLHERDVFALQQASNGDLFAGTNHGIFYLQSLGLPWEPANMYRGLPPPWRNPGDSPQVRFTKSARSTSSPRKRSGAGTKASTVPETPIPVAIAPRIRQLLLTDKAWYAATNEGLFVSTDEGKKWYGEPVLGQQDLLALERTASGALVLVSPRAAFQSHDDGKSWSEMTLPAYVTVVYSIASAPESSLWLSTREGALRSRDGGKTWEHMLGGLPSREILSVHYDPTIGRLLATAFHTRTVFESDDGGNAWKTLPASMISIRAAMSYEGHILAATTHNGLLLEMPGHQVAGTKTSDHAESAVKH